MSNKLIYKGAFFLALYLFIAGNTVSAQEKNTWVLNRILNADNGLPQNSVKDLYFDRSTGLLWVATEGGLVLYNGTSTKIFDTRNVPAFGIARMWAFSRTVDNKVIVVDKTTKAVEIKGSKVVAENAIDYESYNNANFSFQTMPPLRDTAFTKRLKYLSDRIGRPVSILTYIISCIDDATTYLNAIDTIYIVGRQVKRIPVPYLPGSLLINLPGNNIAVIDKNGRGFFIDIASATDFRIKPDNAALFDGSSTIYTDQINRMHFLQKGNKIFLLDITKNGVKANLLAELPEIPQNIKCISFNAKANQLYVGTTFNGIYIYYKSFFYTYQFNDPKKNTGRENLTLGNPAINIYAAVLLDSSEIFITSLINDPYLLCISLNLQKGNFEATNLTPALPSKLETDGKRNVYFPSFKYSFRNFRDFTRTNYYFPIDALYFDSTFDRLLIISGETFGYLEDDTLKPLFGTGLGAETLSFMKRTNGTLVVYNDRNAYCVDERRKKLEKFISFALPSIRDIHVDKDSLAWVTTYGKGMYMHNLKTKKTYHPKPDSKEYLLFAHCLVEDGSGNFFIPTNNGLFHINRKALIDACTDSTKTVFYHYYDKTNGLLQNEFNGGCYPAYNVLQNGDILFPSMYGLVRVYTRSIINPGTYPLFIQKVSSDVKEYDFSENMTFSSGERALSWEVNFAQWEYPTTSGLSYQVNNQTEWKYLDAGERIIRIANLDGNKHTLRIRNQFDLAGKDISILTIHFYIEKRYYEKAWFWILVGLSLFAIIYIAAALRTRQLRLKNIDLERKINRKTVEIKNKNADLEDTLQRLNAAMEHVEQNSRFQQKLIGLLGHDIMVPLQYIAKVSKQIIHYKGKLSEETTTGAVEEIGNTATQLLYMGESIIHWLKLQEGDFIPRYSRFPLHHLVEDLVHLHQPLATEKKTVIENKVPEELHCTQEPVILKIILHNLLLNANKFTSNGRIVIGAEQKNGMLQLSVHDTGVGMDSELVSDLNKMKTGLSKKGTGNEKGWGLGYRFIIDLVRFVKGKFLIESEKGKGTTVTINVSAAENGETEPRQ